MKLLYITQMYPSEELPQYCVFLHLQVKALIANGVQITVVIPTTQKATEATVYDGVNVIYLSYRDYSRSVLYGLVSRRLIGELRPLCAIDEYDAVYAIHAPANILNFARILSQKHHKPLIVHYRGYNVFEEFKKEPKVFLSDPEKVREKVVKASALSIGVSQKTVDIITERFPDAPVTVVYNGVDTSLFTSSDQPPQSSDIHILCVANLIPIKGHKYLFDAVKVLSGKHPELTIITDIVGRGFYEPELKKYVEENHIPNIVFHGYVPHDEVAKFMMNTDIFVLPSIYEAMANVCFEAMACKKPVVIFEGQGTDEIIENGVNGFIAEKGSADDLAAKTEPLILDKDLRKTIGENGYRTVKELTWDASAKNIIRAVESVLTKNEA